MQSTLKSTLSKILVKLTHICDYLIFASPINSETCIYATICKRLNAAQTEAQISQQKQI
jgi:hypothetical protein